jgi:hypothetical protein
LDEWAYKHLKPVGLLETHEDHARDDGAVTGVKDSVKEFVTVGEASENFGKIGE